MSRYLFINHEYPPYGGGAGKATWQLAKRIPGCTILTMKGNDRRPVGPEVKEVPPLRTDPSACPLWKMVIFIVAAFVQVAMLPRSKRPDRIVAFLTIPAGLAAYLMNIVLGIPYVVFLRGGDVPGFMPGTLGRYHRILKPIIHAIWRRAQSVVSNGDYLKRLATKSLPAFRIHDIPNGVERPEYRHRPLSPLRCIYAGRLVMEQKGLEELPAIWRVLEENFSSLHPRLEVIGDGPGKAYLSQRMPDMDVTFTGWIPREQFLERLGRSHLFIHLSRYEGVGNTVLEALAAGCLILIHPAPCNLWAIPAPGVFSDPEAVDWNRFDQLSAGNYRWSWRFDWDESATALNNLLQDRDDGPLLSPHDISN
jgi:glycosyltransferase involved in cell wall biosynthesis